MPDKQHYDALASSILTPEMASNTESQRQTAGVKVYRNNVRASLSKALAERFPVIEKLTGEEFFNAMAQEYFKAHPPASPLIRQYGDHLPAFLQQFKPVSNLPYLADVARLEIAWLSAYHAADAEPLAAAAIMESCGDNPDAAQPVLHPSLHLTASPYPIASIWRMNKLGAPPPDMNRGESILVIRPRREVNVITLAPGIYAALCAISEGANFGGAVEAGLAQDPALDPQSIFQTVFDNELVVGI